MHICAGADGGPREPTESRATALGSCYPKTRSFTHIRIYAYAHMHRGTRGLTGGQWGRTVSRATILGSEYANAHTHIHICTYAREPTGAHGSLKSHVQPHWDLVIRQPVLPHIYTYTHMHTCTRAHGGYRGPMGAYSVSGNRFGI